MLAQNFKTAEDLHLTEEQKEALIKTLVLLETGKLHHAPIDNEICELGGEFTGHFNMHTWGRTQDCGTIACIGGTAELIGRVSFKYTTRPYSALYNLFEPNDIRCCDWRCITPAQAATALRSYLTTGDARWDLAVSL